MKAVIDSNIIFSALLKKETGIKKFILDPDNEIYTCNFLFVELFKHKEKIETFSCLDLNDILISMRIILSRIHFVNEGTIPAQIFREARSLCSDIDENDSPFVALSLFLDTPLITGDKKLMNGLKGKGFEKIISLDSVL